MAIARQLSTAELLYRSAKRMGLHPSWVRPSSLISIITADGEQYVNLACSQLNSHVGVSLAKDKHLTRLILERQGMRNIPFARPETQTQAQAFLDKHQTIVVKPVSGSGSNDIHIVTHMDQIDGIDIRKYIFEKYIPGKEVRYLVLNGEVVAMYESRYGTSVEVTRDLECFSYRAEDWDPDLISVSLHIASIFDLKFAAIDYLVDAKGQWHILEVNTIPDLKWFHAPTGGPSVDVAALFLEATLARPRTPSHA